MLQIQVKMFHSNQWPTGFDFHVYWSIQYNKSLHCTDPHSATSPDDPSPFPVGASKIAWEY